MIDMFYGLAFGKDMHQVVQIRRLGWVSLIEGGSTEVELSLNSRSRTLNAFLLCAILHSVTRFYIYRCIGANDNIFDHFIFFNSNPTTPNDG